MRKGFCFGKSLLPQKMSGDEVRYVVNVGFDVLRPLHSDIAIQSIGFSQRALYESRPMAEQW